jgi:hypothetical protein
VEANRVVRRRGCHIFEDNQLTDGGEVSFTRRQAALYPQKIPGTHFCLRLTRPQGPTATGRIRPIKKTVPLS